MRKQQTQTYLEQNEGAGLQHLALKTDDIFSTIHQMRPAEENFGEFELIKTRHKHVESGMTLMSYTGLHQTLVMGEQECGDTLSLSHNLHNLHF
jgi:hypothetical protein